MSKRKRKIKSMVPRLPSIEEQIREIKDNPPDLRSKSYSEIVNILDILYWKIPRKKPQWYWNPSIYIFAIATLTILVLFSIRMPTIEIVAELKVKGFQTFLQKECDILQGLRKNEFFYLDNISLSGFSQLSYLEDKRYDFERRRQSFSGKGVRLDELTIGPNSSVSIEAFPDWVEFNIRNAKVDGRFDPGRSKTFDPNIDQLIWNQDTVKQLHFSSEEQCNTTLKISADSFPTFLISPKMMSFFVKVGRDSLNAVKSGRTLLPHFQQEHFVDNLTPIYFDGIQKINYCGIEIAHGEIKIRFSGEVKELAIGEVRERINPSYLLYLINNQPIAVLFTTITFLIGVILSIVKSISTYGK